VDLANELVSVTIQVPRGPASAEEAGQLLSAVVRAFPVHAAALRANPVRFGGAQQTLEAAMAGLGYYDAHSSDSGGEDDSEEEEDDLQPVGDVTLPNTYHAPIYPPGYADGWVHPPPLVTPYPPMCECPASECCVRCRDPMAGQQVDGSCSDFLTMEKLAALTVGDGFGGYQDQSRPENDKQRFRCYKEAARLLGYTYRQQLPNCVVAMIRSIWPAADGVYTGYRAASEYTSSDNEDDY
jgi:hypothetical protein